MQLNSKLTNVNNAIHGVVVEQLAGLQINFGEFTDQLAKVADRFIKKYLKGR